MYFSFDLDPSRVIAWILLHLNLDLRPAQVNSNMWKGRYVLNMQSVMCWW